MTEAVPTATTTAEQLFELAGGGKRYELVCGSLRVSEPSGWRHGDVQAALLVALRSHARAHGLGTALAEVGFLLRHDPDTVRAPDGVARILRPGDTLDGGEVVPEFRLPLDELFALP